MTTVEPIRNKSDIKKVEKVLARRGFKYFIIRY